MSYSCKFPLISDNSSAQNNTGKLGVQHDRSSVNLGGQIHNLGGQPFSPRNLYIIHKSIHFLICTESETKNI